MQNDLAVRSVRGQEVRDYLDDLARLRIDVFREFPYLYDGDADYERAYLETYAAAPDAVVILVSDGAAVVGASTGIPLARETDDFKVPFSGGRYRTESIFYCGESVLLPAYRGRGIYRSLFAGRERHARSLGGFAWCAFCAVERPPDHPLRPRDYVPLDAAWEKFGYRKHPELRAHFRWKDVDRGTETSHPMSFWLKPLESERT